MKKLLFITILFICVSSLKAQSDSTAKSDTAKSPEVFMMVERVPEYPGGQTAMLKFISKNLKYPPKAVENGKEGTVYVQFVVDTLGNVTKAKAIRSFDDDCGKEAVRVVSLMKFIPGETGRKKVMVNMTLPLKFKLME